MIPKPLPFMRTGLANLPLILALDLLSPGAFALLALIKVLGQALITGTLFSYVFLFSLAGTAASGTAMYLLRKTLGPERTGFTGISVAGALLSNTVQMLLACFFIFGSGAKLMAPPFLAAGIVTGAALGLFCEAFAARSLWFGRQLGRPVPEAASGMAGVEQKSPAAAGGPCHEHPPGHSAAPDTGASRRRMFWSRFRPGDLCAAALIMAAAFLCNPSPLLRIPQFLLFWLFAFMSGKKIRPLVTLTAILGIVICNLFPPYGRVLAEWGALRITGGALLTGLRKALTLEGLILLSRASIRPDLRFPGPLGALVAESFRLFERIGPLGTGGGERKAGLMAGIDRLMLELSAEQEAAHGRNPSGIAVPENGMSGPAPLLPGRLILCAAALTVAAFTAAGFLYA